MIADARERITGLTLIPLSAKFDPRKVKKVGLTPFLILEKRYRLRHGHRAGFPANCHHS